MALGPWVLGCRTWQPILTFTLSEEPSLVAMVAVTSLRSECQDQA